MAVSGAGPLACPLCAPSGHDTVWTDGRIRVVQVQDTPLPGYMRVIWHEHIAEMTALAPRARHELMAVIYEVERLQRQCLHPDKINLASLGNQVPHLHWHVIPRWRGDPFFPDSAWSPPRPAAETGDWPQIAGTVRDRLPAFHRAVADALNHRAA